MVDTKLLEDALARLPRYRLAQLPTPLQPAPRLSAALGGPAIYFKRDDLTGWPLAGNKTRMFEFVLPRILATGADCVVGGAPVQSNYCRQLTAACVRAGLEVHLVLMPNPGLDQATPQGNLLLDLLMGAHVHLVEAQRGQDVIDKMLRLADRLRQAGRRPFVARMANTDDLGLDAASYVNCAVELRHQFDSLGLEPDCVYLASADTTQAGLLLGQKVLGERYRLVGISPIDPSVFPQPVPELVATAANKAALELGLDVVISPNEVINETGFVGEGYSRPTRAGLEAIRLVARTEGILLDPVYTSKAMAGLIAAIGAGELTASQTVVFVHTGGYPALFAFAPLFNFENQLSVGDL